MGIAVEVAYGRASEAANAVFAFAKDHPIAMAGMLTIIAVGVLVILAPASVEALGLRHRKARGEEGPGRRGRQFNSANDKTKL